MSDILSARMVLVVGLLVGLVFSLVLIRNVYVAYAIILIFGFITGRSFYYLTNESNLWGYDSLLFFGGLFLGYMLGSYYASKMAILVLFATGFGLAYYLYKKKYLDI